MLPFLKLACASEPAEDTREAALDALAQLF